MSAKISVIVPVYNVERYLRECLDSIIGQTLEDIEIIAINDGSPDNSLEILREYEKKDNRVKVIDKKNEGVGKARNDGINAATGEFIAFMDSDDYYPSKNVLETLYNSAKENNVKIAGGKKIRLTPDGNITQDDFHIEDNGLKFEAVGLKQYTDYQYDYGYTKYIFDRKMLVENEIYFPPYRRFQDPPFFVKAMIAAKKFYVADIESYCYRLMYNESKCTVSKTIDFLYGLRDNLRVSRENGLSKLHYLTAMRLLKEASFMASQNIFEKEIEDIFALMIEVLKDVDADWLKKEGFDLPNPLLPDVFKYTLSATRKYETIRKNKIFKTISKIRKN